MAPLSDVEAGVPALRTFIGDIDLADSCRRRPVSDVVLEAFERFGLSFRLDLDTPVRKIPNPAVQPFPCRGGLSEEPKADSLNPAADQVPSRETHA